MSLQNNTDENNSGLRDRASPKLLVCRQSEINTHFSLSRSSAPQQITADYVPTINHFLSLLQAPFLVSYVAQNIRQPHAKFRSHACPTVFPAGYTLYGGHLASTVAPTIGRRGGEYSKSFAT